MPESNFKAEFVADGKVGCDKPDCQAVDEPKTPDEYRAAYEHWRNHSYLHACSHGK